MAPILAYWDIRGLAEPIRYLHHYKGLEFEDKRYQSRDAWLNDKFSLNLDFPNLPYYIDENVRITQSVTILRYLARKHDFAGTTEEEKVRVELAEQQLHDLRTSLLRTCYSPDFEKIKKDFIKSVPPQFMMWSTFLGDRNFLAGDNITYVDFMAYDIFDFYEYLKPTLLDDFPNIQQYQERIENLPQLQTYLKSPLYRRWPIFGPIASFGGRGEEPSKIKH